MKINFPQKLRLSALLYSKKFTVILSVILAFSLWLGIAIIEKPIRERTFTDLSVSVSLEGTAAEKMGLSIFSDIDSQKFSITVSGPNYLVSELRPEDFNLSVPTVDINSADVYTLDVVATTGISDSELKIKSISPPSVKLNVDSTSEVEFNFDDEDKNYNVLLDNVSVNEEEGFVLGDAIIPDAQQVLRIKGPSKIIENIDSVSAFLDVNRTLSASETFDSEIKLYNANKEVLYHFANDGNIYNRDGNVITNSYLNLSFTSVKVTQEIFKKKVVTCKPKFTNLPSGLTSSDIKCSLDNDKVTILGAPDIVDKTNEVLLESISIRDVAPGSNTFAKAAALSDGLSIVEDIKTFKVSVDTSNYSEATLTINEIKCLGLTDGLKATTNKRINNVRVCGPREIIRKIKSGDLYAVVNLEGKSAGTYTVDVTIKSDVYDTVWQIGTYSTEVTLK